MEFGHLIEFKRENSFPENHTPKYSGEGSSRPFSNKSKLSIFVDRQSEILYSLFLLYARVEDHSNILN